MSLQLRHEARMREMATPGSASVDVVRPARLPCEQTEIEEALIAACFAIAALVDSCRFLNGRYSNNPIFAETLIWAGPNLHRYRELLWEVCAGYPSFAVRETPDA